jgi:hypothetical protein
VAEPHATAALRAFALANGVTAEIRPHYDVRDHRVVQSGFELELLIPRPPRCSGDPGCAECERAHASLLEIAVAVLPRGWRHAAQPFEAAFRYRPETRWRPEIEAVIEMLPDPQAPTDAAAHLAEVRRRLRELGVGDEDRPPLGRAA